MKSNDLISIIMTAFNSEKTIARSIESILKQTYQDYELIIINDGSLDSTGECCQLFRDNRIKYFEKENGGPASARNLALSYAKGKYVCFIDSDDTYEPKYLENLLADMEINKCELSICGYRLIDNQQIKNISYKSEKISNKDAQKYVLNNEALGGYLWNKIFLKRIIDENNIRFPSDIFVCEDIVFVETYLAYCRKVSIIDRTNYNYYVRNGTLSRLISVKKTTMLKAFLQIWRLNTETEYKKIIVKRFIEQYLFFYGVIEQKENLIKLYDEFIDLCNNDNINISACLDAKTTIKYCVYRINPKFLITLYRLKLNN